MKRKSSRAKTTRKSTVTKSSKQNILAITTEIEKEFFSLPAKLVAMCRHEQLSLKQNQARLQTSLKNAEAKQASCVKKLTALKKSGKKSSRKQILTAQKAATAAGRAVTEIKREVLLAKKAAEVIIKKQAGFALLAKELPALRRKMAGATGKTQKKPLQRKKPSRIVKQQPSVTDRAQQDYLPTLPPFSTRSDTSDLT